MTHTYWCAHTAQDHAVCRRQLDAVPIGPEQTAIVELHQARDVPAVITVTIARGPRRSLVALHVEAAHRIGRALDEGVALIVRTEEPNSALHTAGPG
jgi:hypothetical protein